MRAWEIVVGLVLIAVWVIVTATIVLSVANAR